MRHSVIVSILFMLLSFAGCKSVSTPENKTQPTIQYFNANPSVIDKGQATTLTWSISNGTTASINQGIGSIAMSGEAPVSPASTTVYTLTAGNSNGIVTAQCAVTVREVAVVVLDGDLSKGTASDGHLMFAGFVKNTGAVPAYNCKIEIRAYSDLNASTLIDTAVGSPGGTSDIAPGERVFFAAVFPLLTNWGQVASCDYKITWSNRNAASGKENGTVAK